MFAGVLLVLVLPICADAQPCGPGGPLFAMVPGTVKVMLHAGETFRATLVCVDRDTIVVANGTRTRQLPLADVARIVKPRDSIVNGALIGVGLGIVVGIATYGTEASYSTTEASYLLEVAITLGGVGAALDAMRGSEWTVYTAPTRPPSVGLTWRMRF